MSEGNGEPENVADMVQPQLKKRPAGQFSVHRTYMMDHWREMLPIFAHVAIVRVNVDFLNDTLTYAALSDLFEETNIGEEPPFYDPILEDIEGETFFKGFVKR